jgi:dTDP-3-amino-2,3,6-trideoxy-4-keto-D-glucose/dTDP-3-amino-3,4,6-trideoxy-alpha-D-glucose/dTDP-2,6-dideoxy-D-kanosamine transaminase
MLDESNQISFNPYVYDRLDVATRSEPIYGYDARRSIQLQRAELLQSFHRVLDSGNLILGQEVSAFEVEFAEYIGSKHAIGVSSGTDALIAAMKVLGIGQGHEVITVANGPVPTAAAIQAVGATPCFVDVEPNSLQMDPVQMRSAIRSQTRCVIPVHLYGQSAPMIDIADICRQYGIFLIEDCAQAHGTHFANQHVGGFGDISCFSFYPTKNLGALGDAGMCVTNDAHLSQRLREVGQYGYRERQRIAYSNGINCRLDELQAAFLRTQLPNLRAKIARRHEIAEFYLTRLRNLPFCLPEAGSDSKPSWHQFVIRCRQRSKLIDFLRHKKIFASIHYEWPVHSMPAFSSTSIVPFPMPVTELACKQVVSLPVFPELLLHELERVVRALHEAVQNDID